MFVKIKFHYPIQELLIANFLFFFIYGYLHLIRNVNIHIIRSSLNFLIILDFILFFKTSINFEKITSQEFYINSLKDRSHVVVVKENKRYLLQDKYYNFTSKQWLITKTPSNHGYEPSDSPLYWYIKSYPYLEEIALFPPQFRFYSIVKNNDPNISDNIYIEQLIKEIPSQRNEPFLVDALPSQDIEIDQKSCEILSFEMKPNTFKVETSGEKGCFLALQDKNYPGWKVFIDGVKNKIIKTNIVFKGVYIPAGKHLIEFSFLPRFFFFGMITSLIGIIFSLLLFFKKLRS